MYKPLLTIAVISTHIISFCLGMIVMHQRKLVHIPPMQLTEDRQLQESVVTIDSIVNGRLIGFISGPTRLFVGNQYLLPNEDGKIDTDAAALLTDIIRIEIPKGMRFVASRKGKKYYPIDSSGGKGIVPRNRMYFATEQDARDAGFLP